MDEKIKSKLIANGVKNLKTFGYPNVNSDNILTDEVYSAFFKEMLEEAKGQSFDEEINSILKIIR